MAKINNFANNDVEILSVKTKYQGFFKIEEYHLRHQLFNGGYSKALTRELFERGDAVVLMPYDPSNDQLIFVNQFRIGGLNRAETPWLLEFIAGMFGVDENPVEVAIREAKEEANLSLTSENIQCIMEYLSSPGGTSEKIHLYVGYIKSTDDFGKPLSGVFGLPEEGEDISVSVISRVRAMQLLEQGKINNAATVIGLQWLQLNYQQIQQQFANKNHV